MAALARDGEHGAGAGAKIVDLALVVAAKVVAAAKNFQAEIREIQRLSVGQPLPSERPVVDDSFDVGLVMRFANAQDLSTYEKHPVHVQAVKEILQPIAKKLLVYDVVAE